MKPGRALTLSDDQLAQLAAVSPVDIDAAARALWPKVVPFLWKRLLESQTVGTGPLTTPFVWDAQSRRYIHLASKRYVPFTEIRDQAIEPLVSYSKSLQRTLSTQLQAGAMKLNEWQRGMMDSIKQTQVAAALAVNGGEANSNQVDYQKIAAEILILYLLLRGFAEEIEAGSQALNGKLLVRSDLYAGAARDIFEEIRRHGMTVHFGVVQEQRMLGRAEHCHTDGDLIGCAELHDLGWQAINTLPRLGQTPCRTNCKCRFIYRYQNDAGAWIVVDDTPTIALILKQAGKQ